MKKLIVLITILLGVVDITAPSVLTKGHEENKNSYIEYIAELNLYEFKHSNFSIEQLKQYLDLKKVVNANQIIAQAVLETGWFNSGSFKDANNLFGMKLAKCRKTTAIGSYLGHAKYNHWTDSVDDYMLWLNYWQKFGYEYNNHYDFLSTIGYATDPYYNNKLRQIERKIS